MFDHVTLRAGDLDASQRFYATGLLRRLRARPDGNHVEVVAHA